MHWVLFFLLRDCRIGVVGVVLKHCLILQSAQTFRIFEILIFIFWHQKMKIPYLLDQKPRLLIISAVAEGGYTSTAATIQEQCLLTI